MNRGYDYIVVGGGSAGCVLASRLSENPSVEVLLVEAGPRDWNPFIRVPLLAGWFHTTKYHNWGYETEPEPRLANRRIGWPRGRVLGGSSAINGMVYTRGNRGDYDGWAQMALRDWSYEKVLPFFKRSENFEDGDNEFHGSGGPLPVTRPNTAVPLYDAFIEAGRQAGYPLNSDFNGEKQEGFGRYHFTARGGERWSTARAFVDPARSRKNFHTLTGAHLLRVTFEGTRASGVEVLVKGERRTIAAAREIVLSCGAISSPTALMHSGIGAADELARHGVKCVADRPAVGRNLQDHLTVRVLHSAKEPDPLYDLRRFDRAILQTLRAIVAKSGPATSFPLEGGAFLRSRPEVAEPDLQIHFFPGIPARSGMRHPLKKKDPAVYDGYGFAGTICQLRPESRGEIALRDGDPLSAPLIRANYLATEGDRQCMRTGVRMLRDVLNQKAFARFGSVEVSPGAAAVSDADIDDFLAKNAGTIFHPVGTCRMGVDPASVVDEELRVRGVEGLRVADASIMPTLVSSNTNAPTIMIAEKCAAMMTAQ